MANVGGFDRIARFVVGGALLIAAFLPAVQAALGGWAWLLLVPGIGMLASAIFRFCPAYSLFGLNSCPMRRG